MAEDLSGEIDLYAVLGVDSKASQAVIKKSYIKKAKEYHPDLNPNDKDATAKFQEISRAYEILSDPKRRDHYDRTGNTDDAYFNRPDDFDWVLYFSALYKKVTEKDIEEFAKKYRYSAEEQEDLKYYYEKYKGDMNKILESIVCSTDDDYERFYDDLSKYIKNGELKKYPAFKKLTKKQKEQRKKRQAEEEESLAELIRNRRKTVAKDFKNLIHQLKDKYAEEEGQSFVEPSEEEFRRIQEELEKKRQSKRRKKRTSNETSNKKENKRGTKRKKDDDSHLESDDSPKNKRRKK